MNSSSHVLYRHRLKHSTERDLQIVAQE